MEKNDVDQWSRSVFVKCLCRGLFLVSGTDFSLLALSGRSTDGNIRPLAAERFPQMKAFVLLFCSYKISAVRSSTPQVERCRLLRLLPSLVDVTGEKVRRVRVNEPSRFN